MNRLKQSNIASFIIIADVYILASLVGILCYRALPLDWWLSLLIADVAATAVTFIFSVLFGNASVYDPYWSVQPLVILTSFAVGRKMSLLCLLLLVVIGLWGLRLTANWAYTFGNLTHQDWRYAMLREKTGRFYPFINFAGIHLVPTLVVYGCILPAVFALLNGVPGNMGSVLCLCLSFGAVILQGTADFQMHRFRQNRTGTFMRSGVWKYARHPNYLGEIVMWWGVALAVTCASPSHFYLCAGALANTVLFLAVSIPLAEGKQSQKPGYAAYKKETRMLFPIKR